MDMSMDTGMDMSMGNMIMYLHFTPGDNLWFFGWAPRSAGAMVGTCIGLFLLAMAERWLAAMHGVMERHWHIRSQIVLANRLNASSEASSAEMCCESSPKPAQPGRAPLRLPASPFIVAHDVPRGLMKIAMAGINFLCMLAVMTFQLGFIFSIVVGFGAGEALFGRYSLQTGHMH
ncbi:Ctr copper transporter [Gloeopeniophorella convolvens]|nr:Ctr copper transporter [Gloeopeniophorella convolvens]